MVPASHSPRGAAAGAAAVGPNSVDSDKQGTQHHLAVDGNGTPLAEAPFGANWNDCKLLRTAVDAIPSERNGSPGRPRWRPEKLRTDKVYDHAFCRQAL